MFNGCVDYDPEVGVLALALPYWPESFRKIAYARAQRLIEWCANPILNLGASTPLTADDSIILVGGAYGWMGDALLELIPGIAVVCVDISDYVQLTKDQSPNDALRAAIIANGYDPDLPNSVGQVLFDYFRDDNPRASGIIPIVAEDMGSNGSKRRVIAQLPRDATRAISEESWGVIPVTDQVKITTACGEWGIELIHIWNKLIGH